MTVAEVEGRQVRDHLAITTGDLVEILLHPRSEPVVDQVGEILFQQSDRRKGGERRNQGRSLLPDVPAILNRGDDRRVRGGATDAQFFETLDQGGLGVTSRRLGGVAFRFDLLDSELVTLRHRRQAALLILQLGIGVIGTLDVGSQEAGERDDLARGGELGILA